MTKHKRPGKPRRLRKPGQGQLGLTPENTDYAAGQRTGRTMHRLMMQTEAVTRPPRTDTKEE